MYMKHPICHFSKEKSEIIHFSLTSKLFKNMALEKIESGEEIAMLGIQ